MSPATAGTDGNPPLPPCPKTECRLLESWRWFNGVPREVIPVVSREFILAAIPADDLSRDPLLDVPSPPWDGSSRFIPVTPNSPGNGLLGWRI